MSAQIQFTLVAGSKSRLLSLPREATIADVAKLLGSRSNISFTVADGCTPSSTTTLGDLSELSAGQLSVVCAAEKTMGVSAGADGACCCCAGTKNYTVDNNDILGGLSNQ